MWLEIRSAAASRIVSEIKPSSKLASRPAGVCVATPPTSQWRGSTSSGELAISLDRPLFAESKISSTTRNTPLRLMFGWFSADSSRVSPDWPEASSKCDFPSDITTITTGTPNPRNPYLPEFSKCWAITSNPRCAYVAGTFPPRSRLLRASLMLLALFKKPNPTSAMFLYVTAATCIPLSPFVK